MQSINSFSLAQTAAPDEVHAGDVCKLQMVGEDFLKSVCDLIAKGLDFERF